MMKTGKCPACGITWQGEDIADHFEQTVSREKAEVIASHYGWAPDNRLRFKINMIGIETSDYDGVSYWKCLECGKVFDRFTGEQI